MNSSSGVSLAFPKVLCLNTLDMNPPPFFFFFEGFLGLSPLLPNPNQEAILQFKIPLLSKKILVSLKNRAHTYCAYNFIDRFFPHTHTHTHNIHKENENDAIKIKPTFVKPPYPSYSRKR